MKNGRPEGRPLVLRSNGELIGRALRHLGGGFVLSVRGAGVLALQHLQIVGAYGVGFHLAVLARKGLGVDRAGRRNQVALLDRRRELLQAAVNGDFVPGGVLFAGFARAAYFLGRH